MDLDLSELRKLWEAATKGEWRLSNGKIGNAIEAQSGRKTHQWDDGWRIVATYQDCCVSNLYMDQEANRAANGAMIVAAVNALPALIAAAAERDALAERVRELEAENERLRRMVGGPREHPTFDASVTNDLTDPLNAKGYEIAVQFFLGQGYCEAPEWEDLGADMRFGFRSIARAGADALDEARKLLREAADSLETESWVKVENVTFCARCGANRHDPHLSHCRIAKIRAYLASGQDAQEPRT